MGRAAEALLAGNTDCGKVARSRAAASVGKYSAPFCPQADSSAAIANTPATAMCGAQIQPARSLPTIEVFDLIP